MCYVFGGYFSLCPGDITCEGNRGLEFFWEPISGWYLHWCLCARWGEEGLDSRDVDWLSLGKCAFNWRLPYGYSPSF